MSQPVVVSIVGPTGVGKSDLALSVAEALDAQIVNADAFQVYTGCDIGTAKLVGDQRRGIRHHLMDIVAVDQPFSVVAYQRLGRAALADLVARGVGAVVVGGSGLYVRALLDDLEFPGSDLEIRRRWESELERLGPVALHGVLAGRDPAAAEAILATNGRRIVRALEVGELTGKPFVAHLPKAGPTLIHHVSIGLDVDREFLDAHLDRRVQEMFDAGLVGEVAGLLELGLREGPTAIRALGYAQAVAYLDGAISLDVAIAETQAATRRYARRQQRWFHGDPRTHWFDPRLSTASQILAEVGLLPRRLAQ